MNPVTKEPAKQQQGRDAQAASVLMHIASQQNRGVFARYNQWVEGLKFSHFAVIAMAILVGSCLGSIAAMSVFYHDGPVWAFCIGLFAALGNLVAAIGQAPTKWVVNIFLFSVVVNTLLIFAYVIY
jgi:hypothetical protein